jgi:hypothetical protein
VIATLDADLQDDPAELPRFLERLDKGCDLVVGWKKTRHDPWHKVWPSRVWNGLANAASGLGLHDHNCGFKVMWRDVAAELDLYGELHRYIPILAHARGFGVVEIDVHHRPRKHGQSKYGARRFLRGLVDLGTVTFLTRAGDKPAHVLGGWGACVGLAGLGLLAIAGLCTACRIAPGTRATLGWLGVVGGVLGVKLAALGLVAELVVSHAGRGRARQPVVEHVGGTDASPDGADAR